MTERNVFVADEQSDVQVDPDRFAALAAHVLDAERVRAEAEMAVMFVDDETIADLHLRFLGLEGPTDVLAFPMDGELVESGRQPDQGGRGPGAQGEGDGAPVVVGDVVICPAVAARQASEHDCLVEEELELLLVHGVLHLLDYDHVDEEETAAMQARERELLESFRARRDEPEPT